MSWFQRCKAAVAKWGTEPAKFLLKTVLPAAIPGSGIVVGVAEQVLSLVGGGTVEGEFTEIASESELKTVGNILTEFDGRLADLAEKLLERPDDSPEKLARLVWQEMKQHQEFADALRDIAGMVSRFDRLEAQNRELLAKVGYGIDLQETMLGVARRQEVLILDFVEEQQTAKGQLRELADNVAKLSAAISDLIVKPADALPKLRQLGSARPTSAAVREAVAVSAAFAFDLDLTTSALERAVQLRPDDKPLAELRRQVTIRTRGIGGDSSRPPAKSPAAPEPGFRPGDTIDGWKLLSLLGRGGFGQVFKAEKNGGVRALKVLLSHFIADPHFEANFKREILTLCNLGRHPHIVHFDEFGYDKATGNWYFTMEYIEGESLQTRLMKGSLPPAEAVRLFTLLAGPGGLATVHEKGVVHRDIKPANILILADGSPKLVDFGVALPSQRDENTKTKTGGFTVMFASPEQLRGFPADRPSDVYSLVGSLWYALTKQEPGEFDPDAMPGEFSQFKGIVEKALQQRPKQRHQHGAEVAEVLAKLVFAEPASTHLPLLAVAPRTDRHQTLKNEMALAERTGNRMPAARTIAATLADSPADAEALQARRELVRPLLTLATEAAGRIGETRGYGVSSCTRGKTDAFLRIARVQIEAGDTLAARTILNTALKECLHPEEGYPPDELLSIARWELRLGDPAPARDLVVKVYREWIDQYANVQYTSAMEEFASTRIKNWIELGAALAELGDSSSAKRCFESTGQVIRSVNNVDSTWLAGYREALGESITKGELLQQKRDSAYHDLAEAYATAGDAGNAVTTAKLISDAGKRNYALTQCVKALIERREYEKAVVVARKIRGDTAWSQDSALEDIALDQVAHGDTIGGLATLRLVAELEILFLFPTNLVERAEKSSAESVLTTLIEWATESPRIEEITGFLVSLYLKLAELRINDADEVRRLLDRVHEITAEPPPRSMAILYGMLGETGLSRSWSQIAMTVAEKETDAKKQANQFGYIAGDKLQYGDIGGALATANRIADNGEQSPKWPAYAKIAVAQAHAGDIAGAKRTANQIPTMVEVAGGFYSLRNVPQKAIAEAQAEAGDLAGARVTFQGMDPSDPKVRAFYNLTTPLVVGGNLSSFNSWWGDGEENTDEMAPWMYCHAARTLIHPDTVLDPLEEV